MEIYKEMTIVIEGVTFTKVLGDKNIYSENYGVYIPNSETANTFENMISIASEWLKTQN